MSDQHPTEPLPGARAQWVLSTDAAVAPSRKRRWPWLVALLIVVALAAAAWFGGEAIARSIVERTIREQITRQLDLPADHRIDVDVHGPILPQLIAGTLGDVAISSDDVPLKGVTADVSVHAQDVNIHGGDWSGAVATVTIDQSQLQALMSAVPDFPAASVGIDAPDLTAQFDLRVLGLEVPVGVSLTPSASGGDIVLTPASLRVAGTEITADALRQQFGALASTVLRDWDVCIADRLPKAVELTGVTVKRESVVADFEIDSAILADKTAQAKGTCP